MQNELIKHGFFRKKTKEGIIFEKREVVYNHILEGEIDERHIIIKKKGKYYLSKVTTSNEVKSYCHFLEIFDYPDLSGYGFVYLIKYNDVYKIGMTKNIYVRVRFFKNTLPGKADLMDIIISPYYKELEKYFHEVFKAKLLTEFDREWFKLTEADLLFFKKVKTIVEY